MIIRPVAATAASAQCKYLTILDAQKNRASQGDTAAFDTAGKVPYADIPGEIQGQLGRCPLRCMLFLALERALCLGPGLRLPSVGRPGALRFLE